ncbi:MAG: type II toxin-antitoxin system RatA family toxin [Candidatus Schmidhempelia sp.]|nr:type II toxin-antitoxin system RatA family toxin [Candidatus Schmidhempelia sp.]
MPRINYSVIEPFSTKQLFDLVNDINAYPLFVPNCIQSGIIQQQSNHVIAFLEVEKLGFRKRFVTKNTFIESNQIILDLVDGPFKYFRGRWRFVQVDPANSRIDFELQYEFNSKLLEIAFTPMFKEIMTDMVKAFSQRAKQVYHD